MSRKDLETGDLTFKWLLRVLDCFNVGEFTKKEDCLKIHIESEHSVEVIFPYEVPKHGFKAATNILKAFAEQHGAKCTYTKLTKDRQLMARIYFKHLVERNPK